jgi:hypothetical protein
MEPPIHTPKRFSAVVLGSWILAFTACGWLSGAQSRAKCTHGRETGAEVLGEPITQARQQGHATSQHDIACAASSTSERKAAATVEVLADVDIACIYAARSEQLRGREIAWW